MTARLDHNAASPAGMKALGHVYGHVITSGLDAALLDLVFLRASQINGCAYCIDAHSNDLRKREIVPEKLALLPVWREGGSLFGPQEQAALAWTESVTRVSETGVPQAAFDAARSVFAPKELADLTIAIGLINAYNRLAIAFRTVPSSATE